METAREFIVPGEPRGKGRPRFSRVSGVAYTPTETAAYENRIALVYREKYADCLPFAGEVFLTVSAYTAPPASTSKKRRAAMLNGDKRPTKKPDIDNILKAVLDGLNGVAYRDDKQVVAVTVIKSYAETPGLYVRVTGEEE